jgi:tetratricopeptide (TPR) repeat protein
VTVFRDMRSACSIIAVLCLHGLNAQDVAQAMPDKETERLFRDGENAYNSGGYAKAIDLYTQVLMRDPENLNAYLQRGFCHNLRRDYAAAVEDFTAVIGRKPDHLWAYTSRGSAYNKLGKYDLAIRDFDTAIGFDTRNEEAYNNRGWARKSSGDPTGACKDWKTSKKLGNAEARIILENNRCK